MARHAGCSSKQLLPQDKWVSLVAGRPLSIGSAIVPPDQAPMFVATNDLCRAQSPGSQARLVPFSIIGSDPPMWIVGREAILRGAMCTLSPPSPVRVRHRDAG